jgi:FKBP-type peptidyl-prolyl cis-trans isomerase
MFNKYELFGGALSILCMATALYLTQVQTNVAILGTDNQNQIAAVAQSGVVVAGDSPDTTKDTADALTKSVDKSGNLKNMVIDDVKIGTGAEVKNGDTVSVHYIGTLQNGTEFDNSKKRGEGWEEGLIGMKVGGSRILVIPPDKGYGEKGIGPIPGNATLVFAIELLEVK